MTSSVNRPTDDQLFDFKRNFIEKEDQRVQITKLDDSLFQGVITSLSTMGIGRVLDDCQVSFRGKRVDIIPHDTGNFQFLRSQISNICRLEDVLAPITGRVSNELSHLIPVKGVRGIIAGYHDGDITSELRPAPLRPALVNVGENLGAHDERPNERRSACSRAGAYCVLQ